jgi:O-acetyl-ADP-ribose deacetylase (regulator of RNase III)
MKYAILVGDGTLFPKDDKALKKIAKDFDGKKIAYPMIGAGLGGGDWSIIYKIIREELKDQNHTLVEYGGR